MAQKIPVFESFSEEHIAEWMNANEKIEITDGMIACMIQNH